jgi:hypothetical protein
MIISNWLVFRMFSASFLRKALYCPLFSMSYQLRGFAGFGRKPGHNVERILWELRKEDLCHKGLL